jgi:dUTP pyrophosphatase
MTRRQLLFYRESAIMPDSRMPDTRLIVERRHPDAILPKRANATDACYDLALPEAASVPARATSILDLHLAIELEPGWEAQIRGRSGLATKGIIVHPGTIDHLYRQNLKVIIHNVSDHDLTFAPGDRIAQMKVDRVWEVSLIEATVTPTSRGGLGSTGQ